ncbi:hypothetical protein AB0D83_18775 [Streptomyces decoyicus]|uniref:hypothetical protein n=1 Tax=Streptomyces decoyicus TaxID=249567 RepID=UPI0033D0B189
MMRAAHSRWDVPAQQTIRTLRRALALDGELSEEARETYFVLLSPSEHTDD